MLFHIDIEKRLSNQSRQFTLQSRITTHGERLALFGPSGSGKSLTLLALAGLLRPDRGRIAMGERVLFDSEQGLFVPPSQRRVGFVFQDYALFPHLTVRQNAAFGLRRLFRRLTAAQSKRVDDVLELFGLAELAGCLPGEISGGQRQRVALARAVAPSPELLLLDEPFSALDQPLRVRVRRETRRLLDMLNIPAVLVTHDPEDVQALADIVVVYREGRVVRVAEAENSGASGPGVWLDSFEAI
ncbi:ATP-binding cassette domain-containing protein [Desulfocurvibacter africanus]|uniref:Fe(3+)-transporting ATPase n=1 Tax=Desulfocurvibacter africanus subsp. africanus str. Walvis Bay TaxID=690850 RepID=F3Z284_DESAF|nr:ATP-binding cassette domain-containing protein [Desulfocurvibacter africanus]EGJ50124.1 Fe(3+)-transporting ATPase [Desulfocurvibacter africanus subsp. africanus str. Walvis Bay]